MPNDTIHTVGKFDCPYTRCFCLSDLYGLELRSHGCMVSFSSVMMITYWSTGTSAWIIWRKELQKHCFKWYVKIDFGLWPCQNIWFKRGCMEHCSSLWHEKSIQRLILLFDYLVILSRTETKTCHQRTSFDKRWPRPSRISGTICNGRLMSFYDVISQANENQWRGFCSAYFHWWWRWCWKKAQFLGNYFHKAGEDCLYVGRTSAGFPSTI